MNLSGYAAVFHDKDHVNDVIMPGAFAASILTEPSVPVLWLHRADQRIGTARLSEDDTGLRADMVLDDTDKARKVRDMIEAGAVSGMSIGYRVTQSYHEQGTRFILAARLFEVSIVLDPIQPRAALLLPA
jgi:HK97 family phage prohead protease